MSFESRNPATGEIIETYPQHSAADIEACLVRTWSCWKSWSRVPLAMRTAFLNRLAAVLESRVDEFARLITLEMGKPYSEAQAEVKKAASGARHFAQTGPEYIEPEVIPGTQAQVIYQPLGPILGVMPWNLPFWQVLRFFIPAALVGNTVIVKHAENVKGCALALEQLVKDAGGPDGLYVNLMVDRKALPAIVADERIRAVTVTASVAAGRAMAAVAGQYGKKAVLELGGSDPFVVLDDADLTKAVQLGVTSRFSNNAQSCIAAKRFLIAESVFEEYTSRFVEAVKAIAVGDPMQPSTKFGPLARSDLRDTVHRQVKDALAQGARILTGGKFMAAPGYFYEPTVLTGLRHDAPIVAEECFGPVAMLFPFADDAQAVHLANSTEYGLGAAVCSKNLDRARTIAAQIEAGAVFINDFVRSDPRAPFGGVKNSGFGRELGALGARELTNAKLVWQGA
ncbi:MAG: NAD-dependent succinate-semialdehyde dehydrogenase [Steroidobacteraceae bacterium]|jgi:succinate-semialdehyde dehydrogenase/glutarate-semialdehyde dehydrogenase/succinate-semialdehyde dehydrogenase